MGLSLICGCACADFPIRAPGAEETALLCQLHGEPGNKV